MLKLFSKTSLTVTKPTSLILYIQLQCIEFRWFVDQGAGYKIMISFKTSRIVSGVWLLNTDQATRHSLYKIVTCMVSTLIKVTLKQKLGSCILHSSDISEKGRLFMEFQ